MKFTTAATALFFAAAVNAAAVSPQCGMPGETCKRSPEPIEAWCKFPGQGCKTLKRSADALAEAIAEAEPEASIAGATWVARPA